jgi:hypothetical protein
MNNWYLDRMNLTGEEKEYLAIRIPEIMRKVEVEMATGLNASNAVIKVTGKILEDKQEATDERHDKET